MPYYSKWACLEPGNQLSVHKKCVFSLQSLRGIISWAEWPIYLLEKLNKVSMCLGNWVPQAHTQVQTSLHIVKNQAWTAYYMAQFTFFPYIPT